MATNALVQGSLRQIAQTTGRSLAESFLSCDAIVIVDVSGSMSAEDSRDGLSRYDVANQELKHLQESLPGKIALIAFSSEVQFCPSGVAAFQGGGTDLSAALKFCKVADLPGIKFVLVSDGVPNDPEDALRIAKTYTNHIDTIFVGPEDDHEGGKAFLAKLAKISGGQAITQDCARELNAGIQQLLLKA